MSTADQHIQQIMQYNRTEERYYAGLYDKQKTIVYSLQLELKHAASHSLTRTQRPTRAGCELTGGVGAVEPPLNFQPPHAFYIFRAQGVDYASRSRFLVTNSFRNKNAQNPAFFKLEIKTKFLRDPSHIPHPSAEGCPPPSSGLLFFRQLALCTRLLRNVEYISSHSLFTTARPSGEHSILSVAMQCFIHQDFVLCRLEDAFLPCPSVPSLPFLSLPPQPMSWERFLPADPDGVRPMGAFGCI